ncbi:glycoside hydrolase family 5 protein [Apiospora hydei]|uniref:cellulase n=1 Tax=Apiospora hydei TaxID=1337664 RepID=A0ABR1X4M3_9PEZI
MALAKVQYLDANVKKGVSIAGGDFGCQTDGTCALSSAQLPGDGADQMKHFVGDLGMNMMRLPISWQFLVNNQLGGDLDTNNLGKYDQMVQSCLKTGAHCMIDIHNFARWNGGVIGQGGPSDDQFVSLWTQLATKYAKNDKVAFELMNEPHDLDVNIWAQTCQKVVTAIRQAGATSQMILLPGTNFDSAATLVSSGSATALMGIQNPDGTTNNLVLDIHKYLDEDNSGTHKECVTDNVEEFKALAKFLRDNGRKGLVSESGASGAASCLKAFCSQNNFINANSDVFVGFVGWAAGSFDASYVMGLTPTKQNGKLVDNQLMMQSDPDPEAVRADADFPVARQHHGAWALDRPLPRQGDADGQRGDDPAADGGADGGLEVQHAADRFVHGDVHHVAHLGHDDHDATVQRDGGAARDAEPDLPAARAQPAGVGADALAQGAGAGWVVPSWGIGGYGWGDGDDSGKRPGVYGNAGRYAVIVGGLNLRFACGCRY